MSKRWEEDFQKELLREVEDISLDSQRSEEILQVVHRQIGNVNERRVVMRTSKKRMVALAAAAIMAVGSISAVAAGQIVGLRSSVSQFDAFRSAAETEKAAQKTFNAEIEIPEQLAEGLAFYRGYQTEVEALDEKGNVVGSYPEISATYGTEHVDLTVKKLDYMGAEDQVAKWDVQEVYEGIEIKGKADAYLFLPPGTTPSEEDTQLEKEGKLYISYGSDQAVRQTFYHVTWKQDGITYAIHNFDAYDTAQLMEMAKAYIGA